MEKITMKQVFRAIILLGVILNTCVAKPSSFDTSASRKVISLDPDGKYIMEWLVNPVTQVITFNATVQTTGFVGFGLSYVWGMLESDIIIGGIWPNGTLYFADRHGAGWGRPPIDAIQNWNLLSVSENSTHTHLAFSRLLDTGDDAEDVVITNNTIIFVWSFGESDEIKYHVGNRGTQPVNVFD